MGRIWQNFIKTFVPISQKKKKKNCVLHSCVFSPEDWDGLEPFLVPLYIKKKKKKKKKRNTDSCTPFLITNYSV